MKKEEDEEERRGGKVEDKEIITAMMTQLWSS